MARSRKNIVDLKKAHAENDSAGVYKVLMSDMIDKIDGFDGRDYIQGFLAIMRLQSLIDKENKGGLDPVQVQNDEMRAKILEKINSSYDGYEEYELTIEDDDDEND